MFIASDGSLNVYGGDGINPYFVTLPSLNDQWEIGGYQYLAEAVYQICSVQVLNFLSRWHTGGKSLFKHKLSRRANVHNQTHP